MKKHYCFKPINTPFSNFVLLLLSSTPIKNIVSLPYEALWIWNTMRLLQIIKVDNPAFKDLLANIRFSIKEEKWRKGEISFYRITERFKETLCLRKSDEMGFRQGRDVHWLAIPGDGSLDLKKLENIYLRWLNKNWDQMEQSFINLVRMEKENRWW